MSSPADEIVLYDSRKNATGAVMAAGIVGGLSIWGGIRLGGWLIPPMTVFGLLVIFATGRFAVLAARGRAPRVALTAHGLISYSGGAKQILPADFFSAFGLDRQDSGIIRLVVWYDPARLSKIPRTFIQRRNPGEFCFGVVGDDAPRRIPYSRVAQARKLIEDANICRWVEIDSASS